MVSAGWGGYRGAWLIRNSRPPRGTIWPWALSYFRFAGIRFFFERGTSLSVSHAFVRPKSNGKSNQDVMDLRLAQDEGGHLGLATPLVFNAAGCRAPSRIKFSSFSLSTSRHPEFCLIVSRISRWAQDGGVIGVRRQRVRLCSLFLAIQALEGPCA